MQIIDLLSPERVRLGVRARSRKRLLELASDLLAEDDVDARAIYSSLCSRERIGSTGLGHGVAIPHGRLGAAETARGAFLMLNDGIDFDAPDNAPVDLVFALVVPEHHHEEHLQLLAQLAGLFSSDERRTELRDATSGAAVMELLEAAGHSLV